MKMRSSPCVGAKYRLLNEPHIITSIYRDQVSLCSLGSRTRRYITLLDFAIMERKGDLIKETPAPSELSDAARLITSEKDRQRYDFRRAYVQAYLSKRELCPLNKSQIKDLINSVANEMGDGHPPGISTLYNWTHRYLLNNRNPIALLPNYPAMRRSRATSAVIALMTHYINTVYLTEERPTIQYTYRLLKAHINHENIKREKSDNPLMATPSYSTLWRMIKNLDRYLTAKARLGAKAAQKIFKHGRALYVDDDLFACSQMDSKRMDLQICDEYGTVIGRPVLSACLNPCTRECTGWDISIGAPCAEYIVNSLKMAISGSEDEPNSGGKVRVLDVDNGAEFVNGWFQNIANILGITIRYLPPGSPDSKSFVERFFETVDVGLVHMLPGTTMGSPQKLGDYDPLKHACIKLSELREIFRKWLKIYHNTSHQELFMSPHQKRQELINKSPPPERYTSDDLEQLCRSVCYRRIRHGKVSLLYLSWVGSGLEEIAEQLGKSQKATIYYNPCDLSEVWVACKSNPKDLIPAYASRPDYQNGLTLSEHTFIRQVLREKHKQFNDSLALQLRRELHEEIQEIKNNAKKFKRSTGKTTERSKAEKLQSRPYVHTGVLNERKNKESPENTAEVEFQTFNLGDLRNESHRH